MYKLKPYLYIQLYACLLLFFILTTTSCSRINYYYRPNDANAVALKKKNDIHFSASTYSLKDSKFNNNQNIQVGYSPIKHLGISSSYFRVRDKHPIVPLRYGNGNFGNIALGGYYFLPMKGKYIRIKKSRRKYLFNNPNWLMQEGVLFDLYLGLGRGKVNNFYEDGGNSQLRFSKKYSQVGIHLFRKRLGVSFNLTFGNINYFEANLKGKIKSSQVIRVRSLDNKSKFTIRESTIRFFLGTKQLRVFASVSSFNPSQDFGNLGVIESNLNFGIFSEIDEFFRKKKKRKRKRN